MKFHCFWCVFIRFPSRGKRLGWNGLKVIIGLIALLAWHTVLPHPPTTRNFTVEDGLPSNECYQVFQDSQGFIWIASDRGVARYNGYEFETFTTADGMPDNTIFGFYEDAEQRIWFRSFNGRVGFFEHGQCHILEIPQSKTISYITGLEERPNRNYKVSFSLGEIITFQLSEQAPYKAANMQLHQRTELEENDSSRRILEDIGKNQFYLAPVFENGIYQFRQWGDTMLLYHWNMLIYSFDGHGSYQTLPIPQGINYMYRPRGEEEVYLTLLSGGYLLLSDLVNNKPVIHQPQLKSCSSVLIDREGGMWSTSLEHGLYYISNLSMHAVYGSQWGVEITHLTGDGATLYFATVSKKVYFSTGHITAPLEVLNKAATDQHPVKQLEFQKGQLILNNNNTFLYENGKVVNPSVYPNLYSTYMDDAGNYWTGSTYGTLFWHVKQEGDLKLVKQFNNSTRNRITQIVRMGDSLWIANLHGITIFDIPSETFQSMDAPESLAKARVIDFEKTSTGTLIIGTLGAGVMIKNNQGYHRITAADGLLSNMVVHLFNEGDSTIWASTYKGISRIDFSSFDPLAYHIRNYTQTDGLLTNRVNAIYVYQDSVYVATTKGINIFSKAQEQPSYHPGISLQSVAINKQTVALKENYALAHDQNNIDVTFLGLYYRAHGNLSYQYRLSSDEDTSWRSTTNRTITLLGLKPGDYTFEVKAINPSGLSSKSPAVLHFSIQPPFWMTWWFGIAILLLIVSIVYLFFRRTISRLRREAALQNELRKLENKALSSQMNPHFIFNALTAVQNYILKEDRYKAYHYLNQFSTLIRKILQNSENERIVLEEEIKLLRLYLDLEKLRFPDQFDYQIEVASNIDIHNREIPGMLIQPYAENAIRHGFLHKDGKGLLHIHFKKEHQILIVVIEDDGIGRQRAKAIKAANEGEQHDSLGMSINKRRLEVLNEMENRNLSITIADVNPTKADTGTRVTLYIPLNDDD